MVEGQGSKTTNVVLGNDERVIDDNGGHSSAGPLKRVHSKHYLSGMCVSIRSRHRYTPFLVLPICVCFYFTRNTNYTYTTLSSRMNNFIRCIQRVIFTFTRSMCVFCFCMFSLSFSIVCVFFF